MNSAVDKTDYILFSLYIYKQGLSLNADSTFNAIDKQEKGPATISKQSDTLCPFAFDGRPSVLSSAF